MEAIIYPTALIIGICVFCRYYTHYTTHEKGEFVIYKHRKKPIEVCMIIM